MSDKQMNPICIRRRELFDRAWTKPMTTNASELGTTTFVLSALARRLGLPLPRAGHWMKRDAGKAPPTPEYPADPELDQKSYPLAAPQIGRPFRPVADKEQPPPALESAERAKAVDCPATEPSVATISDMEVAKHKKITSTRTAIQKSRSGERASIGGRGKFRLLVAPASGERACAVLDRLVAAIETRGWSLDGTEQGYALAVDGETIGLMIEEKLDSVPHVITAAEVKEKAEYDRKCALADRGIGYRPWRPPAIPEHDHVPNGALVLKFDHDYDVGGTRRTFSDGKRQRLEDLIPSVIDSLERWGVAVKARRDERAEQARKWAEQERRRKDNERQARVEGYRIAFLQRQIERKREIDGLSALIAAWEGLEDADPKFAELLDFARLYRTWLEARLAPDAIAKRIAELKLMDDDVYIYDAKRLD